MSSAQHDESEKIHPDFIKSSRNRLIFWAVVEFIVVTLVLYFGGKAITHFTGYALWDSLFLKIWGFFVIPLYIIVPIIYLQWLRAYIRTFSFPFIPSTVTSVSDYSCRINKIEVFCGPAMLRHEA